MAASADLGAAGWTVFTLTPTGSILSGAVAGARAVALLVGLAICGLAGAVLRWRGQASLRAARQEAARPSWRPGSRSAPPNCASPTAA
jgi:two-component system C4-dicarboxylate transport sensor histidine kinase DctB